jgi:hypothetical protein
MKVKIMLILTKKTLEKILKKMKIKEYTPKSFSDMTAIGYILKDAIYVYVNNYKKIKLRKIEISTEIMVQKLFVGWRIWAVIEKEKYYFVKIKKWQTIDEYNGYNNEKVKNNKIKENKYIEYLKSLTYKLKEGE